MTHYHSTRAELALRDAPLSVTDDYGASVEYLDGASGRTYEVLLPAGLRLASDGVVAAVAREIAPGTPYRSAWECLEQVAGVERELRARGYDGVLIDDMPDDHTTHRTITVFHFAAPLSIPGRIQRLRVLAIYGGTGAHA